MTATAAERYHHVVHVWMRGSNFVTRALSISSISGSQLALTPHARYPEAPQKMKFHM